MNKGEIVKRRFPNDHERRVAIEPAIVVDQDVRCSNIMHITIVFLLTRFEHDFNYPFNALK